MTQTVAGLAILVGFASITWVAWLANKQQMRPNVVRLLALLSALGLLTMAFLDWPLDEYSDFFDDHGLVTSLLSSMLLVGLGLFAYEYSELVEQKRLDESITGAGVGGIVDHMIDVEVALSLVSADRPPVELGFPDFDAQDRPLRWLRADRARLSRNAPLDQRHRDPRTLPVALPPIAGDTSWRDALVDEAIRRLLAAIRDWAPVINTSRNGKRVLVAIAELRKDLMELSVVLHTDEAEALRLMLSLRQRARLLAYFFEDQSGARPLRPEVLTTFEPVQPSDGGRLVWSADHGSERMFGAEWRHRLDEADGLLRQAP